MKYLIDTNIFLESLLEQEKKSFVESFLKSVVPSDLCLGRFTLYTLAYMLLKRKLNKEFSLFIKNFAMNINLIDLSLEDLATIDFNVMQKFGLDFDDAYHYCCAKKYNLSLVSFDRDFDRTDLKRVEPSL
jgi:uncharacterized protein